MLVSLGQIIVVDISMTCEQIMFVWSSIVPTFGESLAFAEHSVLQGISLSTRRHTLPEN